ncbi:truncated molybdenum ABC transporter molybdenum-binding protein ModA [Staphylococcus aureus]|nr:truncated molybdenum ABC transporter molybdenum-binding protein ModA [Staphylococcus aureus]
MKLKRLFAVVIAMLLVLAGCSNSNDNNKVKKMTQTMVRNKRFKLQRQQV